jgi:hypothetical protein
MIEIQGKPSFPSRRAMGDEGKQPGPSGKAVFPQGQESQNAGKIIENSGKTFQLIAGAGGLLKHNGRAQPAPCSWQV